jgi:hypothetical protein
MYGTVMTSVAALAVVVPMLAVASPAAEAGHHSAGAHSGSPSRGATGVRSSRPMNMRQQSNRTTQGTGRSGKMHSVVTRPAMNQQKLAPKLGPPANNMLTSKSSQAMRQAVNPPTNGTMAAPAGQPVPIPAKGVPRPGGPVLGASGVNAPLAPIPPRDTGKDPASAGLMTPSVRGHATLPPLKPTVAPQKLAPKLSQKSPCQVRLWKEDRCITTSDGAGQPYTRDKKPILDWSPPALRGPNSPKPVPVQPVPAGEGAPTVLRQAGMAKDPGRAKLEPFKPKQTASSETPPNTPPQPAPTPTLEPKPQRQPPAVVVVPGIGFGDGLIRQAPAIVKYGPHYATPGHWPQPQLRLQPAKAKTAEPVCVEGTWAMQDDEKMYVCWSWYFRGRIYTPDQMAQVLAQLQPQAQ